MLLGHNWVTNGSLLERQVYYISDIGISDYTAQESGQKRVISKSIWVFTDIYNPCLSVSSVQSVFYRTPPIIDDDKKPQMIAPRVTPLEDVYTYALRGIRGCGVENPQGFGIDERRHIHVTEFAAQSNGSIHRKGRDFLLSSVLNNHREHRVHREKRHRSVLSVYSVVDRLHSDSFSQKKSKNNKPQMNTDERRFVAINHRKVREERKAEEQKSLRPLRSLRLINYHGIPTAQGNKEKIIFQTGFTGSTGW